MRFWSIPEQNLLASDNRLEKKDCRLQSEGSRVLYQDELKTSSIGKINADRYLIETEYQDDWPDKLGDKDFVRPTIIEQAQKSHDSRQRKETPTSQEYPHIICGDKLIYIQGIWQGVTTMLGQK